MSEQRENTTAGSESTGKSARNHDDAQNLEEMAAILPEVISSFKKVSPEGRRRLLTTVATFFGLDQRPNTPSPASNLSESGFSEDRSISPKEFLRQKQPRTDVERVACLAYYLTHYRDTPYFKTLDISQLNTEAAQIKFANAAKA